jgi:Skp family chaperone for outer membrane proteins
MRLTGIFLATFFSFFLLTSAAGAQTQAAASKIVVVDTAAFFNEKAGITKIVTAAKALSTELAPRRAEVQRLAQRVDALNKEVETLRGNAGRGIPVDQKTFQNKVDELERAKREGKYQEDEFNAHAQKRQSETVGPVYSEVLRALGEYVKSKDYGILFDASKDQGGMLLYASEKFDITRDFITFFNTRPVTSISSVPVK